MKRNHRFTRFVNDTIAHIPILKLLVLFVVLWLLFAAGLYVAERGKDDAVFASYGDALYWGVAAFSTAGIADAPHSGVAKTIGAIWMILGSVLFFGTIVATITAYFMRPLQRPVRQIVETIEYNLEQLDDLSLEELDLLRDTTEALIVHMEDQKKRKKDEKKIVITCRPMIPSDLRQISPIISAIGLGLLIRSKRSESLRSCASRHLQDTSQTLLA